MQIAIEPKSKADSDKMGQALYKLAQEDPSFHFSRDDETNQTVIEGMGELHLDIIVDRMKREYNVTADVGAPQVCMTVFTRSLVSFQTMRQSNFIEGMGELLSASWSTG